MLLPLFTIAFFTLISTDIFAQVSGTVFRDLPVNGTIANTYGVKDANELGVGGVTVTVYPGGMTTTTAADGTWSIAAPAGAVRVEFSGWPAYLKESADGGGANSSVQFVTAPNAAVNFGLHNPADYSSLANTELLSSIFVNGKANAGGTPSVQGGLVKWPYLNSGTGGATETRIATEQDVGSVWGLAYDKKRQKVYAATMLKRHVGILNNQLGRIYEVNADGTGTAVLIDIPNVGSIPDDVARGLGNAVDQNRDPAALSGVLKVGLGDIDISDDQSTMYVMNLNDKKLYMVDIDSRSIINSFDTPAPCGGTGVNRPFAVEVVDGKVFIGVVCDASISGNDSDLMAYVYEFDGANFTSVYQHSLNYARESTPDDTGWHAWSDNYQTIAQVYTGSNFWKVVRSQPVLADIKFTDNGDMIVGLMDRVGFQGGFQNLPIAGVPFENNLEFKTISGGDVLIASPNGAGQYISASADADGNANTESVNADDSPVTDHKESALGGLTILKGSGEIAMAAYDPMGTGPNAFHTAGVVFFNQTNGNKTDGYKVMDALNPQVQYFGKGAGMGDIELLTDPAPIEIGNLVWEDTDADGVQDAGEPGIAGVVVKLFKADGVTEIGSATTDANGNYIFSNDPNGTTTASHIYNTAMLMPNQDYIVRIENASGPNKQAALGSNTLTPSNTGEGTNAGMNDSDGTANGTNADAPVTAADIPILGANNHTFDFGFLACPPTRCSTVTVTEN